MNLNFGYFILMLVLPQATIEAKEIKNISALRLQDSSSQGTTSGIQEPGMTGLNKNLPKPPQQNHKWTPPASTIPANYVTATVLLFNQGLADPRGCDYREIEVKIGDIWQSNGKTIKTRGWVLPGHKKNQFGICWNGLVYPLVSVGTNACLETDVKSMMSNSITFKQSALSESSSVAINTLNGIRGCLLLRLGHTDLAAKYWAREEHCPGVWRIRNFFEMNPTGILDKTKTPDADPYYYWANSWTWNLFNRMLCAHMRGDENLALVDARLLSKIQPQIEDVCNQRGFKRPPDLQFPKPIHPRLYLSFLDQLPDILADLERRAKKDTHVSFGSITNIPDQATRIRALIKELDQVAALQHSQPGMVNLVEAPIVSALISEKDASVVPLLSCLEQDKRLTRSVSFGRDFQQRRNVISVKNAAFIILESILQASFENGTELRAYWNKYKNLELEERWYAILKDDSAQNHWKEAAACIVQPENITGLPMEFQFERPVVTNAQIKLLGECLRDKRNPTVTELLSQRALEIPTNHIGTYNFSDNCKMAEYLACWDSKAVLSVARILSKRIYTTMKYSDQNLGSRLTKLALYRAKAGDPAPFDDYVSWLETTSPSQFKDSVLDWLDPMKQYPTNSTLQNAAEKLFGTTNSEWGILPWPIAFNSKTVEPGLISIRAYRTLLCRELSKTNLCGSVMFRPPYMVEYTITNLHQNGTFTYPLPAGGTFTNAAPVNIRWGDWIAISLASCKTNLSFNPFLPIEKRDQKINDMIQKLKNNEF